MTDAPQILIINRFVGETIPGVAVVTGDTTGWTLELRVCDPPYSVTIPTVTESPTGTFSWEFDTTGWTAATYHFTLWRSTPDPQVFLEIYLTLRDC
jgi:hypothetical protein